MKIKPMFESAGLEPVDVHEWNPQTPIYARPLGGLERIELFLKLCKKFGDGSLKEKERINAAFDAAKLLLVDENGKPALSEEYRTVLCNSSLIPFLRVFKVGLQGEEVVRLKKIDVHEWFDDVEAYAAPLIERERSVLRIHLTNFRNRSLSVEERFNAAFNIALMLLIDVNGIPLLTPDDYDAVKRASSKPLYRIIDETVIRLNDSDEANAKN